LVQSALAGEWAQWAWHSVGVTGQFGLSGRRKKDGFYLLPCGIAIDKPR